MSDSPKTYLLLRYKLKASTSPDQFEDWVRQTDQPTMRGLKRVKSFNTFRMTGLLMGEGSPAQEYAELFEIDDLEGFTTEDMPGPVVQRIMGEFFGQVEDPEFSICEAIDPVQ